MLCLDYAWAGCKGGCEVSTERAPFVQTTLKTQSGPYSAVCTLCCGVKHLGTTRRTDQGSNKDKGLTVGHRFFKFFTFFVGGSNTLTDPHSGRSFVKKKRVWWWSLFGLETLGSLWKPTRCHLELSYEQQIAAFYPNYLTWYHSAWYYYPALPWGADSCLLSKLFNQGVTLVAITLKYKVRKQKQLIASSSPCPWVGQKHVTYTKIFSSTEGSPPVGVFEVYLWRFYIGVYLNNGKIPETICESEALQCGSGTHI